MLVRQTVVMSEDEVLRTLEATFTEHESLRVRWQTALAPEATSPLAQADAVWPRLPFTEHVRQSLASAWDHFDVVRLTVEQRRLFPTGVNGVLRGGLVASAMALWLVGPAEASVRDQRGLALTDEWYHRRIQYQKDSLAISAEVNVAGQKQLRMLEEDREAAALLRTNATKIQATDVIRWSASLQYGANTLQQKSALLEWQRLGGDAHALGWQLMTQDTVWGEAASGQAEVQVRGSLSNVAEPYLCAWHMFLSAIKRFDELGEPL